MSGPLGLALMLALLLATRHVGMSRWRAGAWSRTRTSALVAVPWFVFPFIGILSGAPWDPRLAAALAAMMGCSVYGVVTWFLRTGWAERHRD